ncbi:hypothetical protein VNO77_30921 [Canavalia gladiata]|uniref:Uncharacterized protein n=1 Tax=Canavalia gladiata TaxID=3824 RepID=A0AAN9Q3S6_CANGL
MAAMMDFFAMVFSLVKEVAHAARRRNAKLFAFVFPDKNGRFKVQEERYSVLACQEWAKSAAHRNSGQYPQRFRVLMLSLASDAQARLDMSIAIRVTLFSVRITCNETCVRLAAGTKMPMVIARGAYNGYNQGSTNEILPPNARRCWYQYCSLIKKEKSLTVVLPADVSIPGSIFATDETSVALAMDLCYRITNWRRDCYDGNIDMAQILTRFQRTPDRLRIHAVLYLLNMMNARKASRLDQGTIRKVRKVHACIRVHKLK